MAERVPLREHSEPKLMTEAEWREAYDYEDAWVAKHNQGVIMAEYRNLKMIRVSTQLPPSVYRQTKQDAARLRVSVAELIRIALGRLDVDDLIIGV